VFGLSVFGFVPFASLRTNDVTGLVWVDQCKKKPTWENVEKEPLISARCNNAT